MGKKRSPNTYQKIHSIFYRDKKNVIMPYDEWVNPALEYLRDVKMYATEKIDGTNIRIEVFPTEVWDSDFNEAELPLPPLKGVTYTVVFKGKTDNAQIPPLLQKHLKETFTDDKVLSALGLKEYIPVEEFNERKWSKGAPKYTIYGEGYGKSIQKFGGRYIKDNTSFILFDVKVDDLYLLVDNAKDIAQKLDCPYVPELEPMTVTEAIELCKKGFASKISEDPTLRAEGVVLKTPIGLLDRRGKRIITKVKCEDFEKYYKTYGTFDKVEQERNPNYKEEE